jgi:hypothetical protein
MTSRTVIPQSTLTKPTVYIVGFAPTWIETPWGDPTAELWGMNALHKVAGDKPWSRWYQLHDIATHHKADFDEHTTWLRESGVPILMWPEHVEKYQGIVPNAIPYPQQAILNYFAPYAYFTNTVSWMIAHAIYESRAKIGVYGVDMAQSCLAPETRVLTADLRWEPVGSLRVGDEVMGFDEHPRPGGRRWRKAVVEQAVELERPSRLLHLEDGTKITSSTEHRWLIAGGGQNHYTRTDRLVARGDYSDNRASHLVRVISPREKARTWEAGYLSAAVDGEGHLSNSRALGFAQRDNAMAETFEHLAYELGYDFRYTRTEPGGTRKYALSGGKAEVMQFLSEFRPPRLLASFDPDNLGIMQCQKAVPIKEIIDIGTQPVIGLKTSTGTYVAEGFATHNSEYGHQRPSCEYFLGIATGRGIEVELPVTSDLIKTPFLYGLEDGSAFRAKLDARQKQLAEQKQQVENQLGQLQQAHWQIIGAIENNTYIRNVWTQPNLDNQGA